MKSFPCYKCGKCCSNVNLATETAFLDRGDGICRYLDTETKLCTIYKKRPDICKIDLQYSKNYSHLYSWNDFVEINLKICDLLPD